MSSSYSSLDWVLQGCSLGLERLGLETVSRRFFGTSRSRFGVEDITFRSRSRDFSLVNMHAMHHACGYNHEENNGSDPEKNNL